MEKSESKNGRSVSRGIKKNARGRGGDKASLLEVDALIETLKKNKVEHYKTDKVEIKFSMLAFLPDVEKSNINKVPEENDDLLFYSAPPRRQS